MVCLDTLSLHFNFQIKELEPLMMSFMAWCRESTCLLRSPLSTTQPMEQACSGRTTPYSLGAAQFEVGDICPVKYEDLFHSKKVAQT